jgi:hypothetical protein
MLYLESPEIPGTVFEFQVIHDDPNFNMGFDVRDPTQFIEHVKQMEITHTNATVISTTFVSLSGFPKPGKEVVMSGFFTPKSLGKVRFYIDFLNLIFMCQHLNEFSVIFE